MKKILFIGGLFFVSQNILYAGGDKGEIDRWFVVLTQEEEKKTRDMTESVLFMTQEEKVSNDKEERNKRERAARIIQNYWKQYLKRKKNISSTRGNPEFFKNRKIQECENVFSLEFYTLAFSDIEQVVQEMAFETVADLRGDVAALSTGVQNIGVGIWEGLQDLGAEIKEAFEEDAANGALVVHEA